MSTNNISGRRSPGDQTRGRCVQCGRAKDLHLEGGRCPDHNTTYGSMDLPDGKTCSDCAFFKFCLQFIGPVALNTRCDWFPIRFIDTAAKEKEPCV